MSTVRFEAREIPEFAEYVTPSELTIGETYFSVQYADENLLTPKLSAYVFLGRDLRQRDAGKLYFQDYASYMQGFRFDVPHPDRDIEIQCFLESQYSGVYDYEHALNELMKCSLRRSTPNSGAT
jgi:hypothetical protein